MRVRSPPPALKISNKYRQKSRFSRSGLEAPKRSRRGSGRVFQRTYRDAKGKTRKTANWYIEFVAGNRTIREATSFTNRTNAAEFLKKRMSDALGGKVVLSRNVIYDGILLWRRTLPRNRPHCRQFKAPSRPACWCRRRCTILAPMVTAC